MPPADPLGRIRERAAKVFEEHQATRQLAYSDAYVCCVCEVWPCPIRSPWEDLLVAVEALDRIENTGSFRDSAKDGAYRASQHRVDARRTLERIAAGSEEGSS